MIMVIFHFITVFFSKFSKKVIMLNEIYEFSKEKNSFPYETFSYKIKNELNLNRPVYYSGSGSGGGHAFACGCTLESFEDIDKVLKDLDDFSGGINNG